MTVPENAAGVTPQSPHYLDGHALVRPKKVAMICGERTLTYAELNARARRVANALSKLGVKAGDRGTGTGGGSRPGSRTGAG